MDYKELATNAGWIASGERPGYKFLAHFLSGGTYVRTWRQACEHSNLIERSPRE